MSMVAALANVLMEASLLARALRDWNLFSTLNLSPSLSSIAVAVLVRARTKWARSG
jgi:hypothetical protein